MSYSMALDVNDSPELLDWRDLTEDQMNRLLSSDWYDPAGVVRLNDELGSDRVNDALVMNNARILLEEARDGLETTSRGNLKRKVVDDFLERMQWPEGYEEDIRKYNKVINEGDVWRLHRLRVLVELAGLIEEAGGAFELTREGRNALRSEMAGTLYSTLFHAQFQVMNLNYRSRFLELEDFQTTINYTLFRLSELDDRWYEQQQLLPHVIWFPMYLEHFEEEEGKDMVRGLFWRLFEPLRLFGLLDLREARSSEETNRFLKKTDLYDDFLSFNLPDPAPETSDEPEEIPISREELLDDISEEDLELVLDNVFCPDCGTVRIVDYEDSIYRIQHGDTVLRGSCEECDRDVVRHIETGDHW